MKNPLPIDPEGGDNNARAYWAEAALRSFMAATGCDAEDALGDLIGNLLHLCDRHSDDFGDFDSGLRRGRDHYAAETTGDGLLGNNQYAPGYVEPVAPALYFVQAGDEVNNLDAFTFSDGPEEAAAHWRGYYDADSDDTPRRIFRVDLNGNRGPLGWHFENGAGTVAEVTSETV